MVLTFDQINVQLLLIVQMYLKSVVDSLEEMFTNVDNFKTVEIVRYLDKAGAGGKGGIHIHLPVT